MALLAGLLVVPTIASFAPTLVNGFLTLVLVGIILFNSDKWMPYLPGVTALKPQEVHRQ